MTTSMLEHLDSIPDPVEKQHAKERKLKQHLLFTDPRPIPIAGREGVEISRKTKRKHVLSLTRGMLSTGLDAAAYPCDVVLTPTEDDMHEIGQFREWLAKAWEEHEEDRNNNEWGWFDEKVHVQLAGGRHRAATLVEMNRTDFQWPSRFYFHSILEDAPALFLLVHGGNTVKYSLPASPDEFLTEMKRRAIKIANAHPDIPNYLLTVKANGDEWNDVLDALEGWVPNSDAKNPEEVKPHLVRAVFTSMWLVESFGGTGDFGSFDEVLSSVAKVKELAKWCALDVSGVGMGIAKKSWSLLFAETSHLLTPSVAEQLDNTDIPTTEAEFDTFARLLKAVLLDDTHAALKQAFVAGQEELTEMAKEYRKFVAPAKVTQTFQLHELDELFFIPLVCAIDPNISQQFGTGKGGRGKILPPITDHLLRQLMTISAGSHSRDQVQGSMMTFIKRIVLNAKNVLDEVKKQKKLAPLGTSEAGSLPQTQSPLRPDSDVGKALWKLVSSVKPPTANTTTKDLLPHAAWPKDPRTRPTGSSKATPTKHTSNPKAPNGQNAEASGSKDKGKGPGPVRPAVTRQKTPASPHVVKAKIQNIAMTIPEAPDTIKAKVHAPGFLAKAFQFLCHRVSQALKIEFDRCGLTDPEIARVFGVDVGAILVPAEGETGETLIEKMILPKAPDLFFERVREFKVPEGGGVERPVDYDAEDDDDMESLFGGGTSPTPDGSASTTNKRAAAEELQSDKQTKHPRVDGADAAELLGDDEGSDME